MADAAPVEDNTQAQTLNIFITAGDSSVGLHLTREAVAHGHKVFSTTDHGSKGAFTIREAGGVPVYPEMERGSSVRSTLLMAKADVVVNLAPAVALNSLPYVPFTNLDDLLAEAVTSTQTLMTAAGQVGVKRLIHVSMASIYGNTHDAPAAEDNPIDTHNAFFKAVESAEDAVLDGGIPGYVVRAGFIYGGHSPRNDALVNALMKGKPVVGGSGTGCFIFDEDLADALLKLVEHTADEEPVADLLNVVDDGPIEFAQFLDLLGDEIGNMPQRLSDLRLQFQINPLQIDLLNLHTVVDNSKAKAQLDWSPQIISHKAGIDRMMLQWRVESSIVPTGTSNATIES